MTPIELLAKISSRVPPPKRPLLRLSGVLGPKSSWRASVVPRAAPRGRHAHAGGAAAKAVGVVEDTIELLAHAGGAAAKAVGVVDRKEPPAHDGGARTGLGSGVVRGKVARIDWASLLKRVFLEDVLACSCGGRRRILADVQERSAIVTILRHLGLRTEPAPLARARAPADLTFELA
jgi:hypothetical protein